MYCSACKVEFPDNLNFCKQCGRPLVVQQEHSVTLSKCCTRCGARVVSGENFCQQCGARARTKTQDTTIGACQQCSTPWRSAWLYCRNCGLDRDRALELASMPSLPNQAVPTLTTEVVSIRSRGEDGSPHCPRCGAAAIPYAQFCDVCGQSLTSSEIEPLPIEDEDGEVHQTTLEVVGPATDVHDDEVPASIQPSLSDQLPEAELQPLPEGIEKELDPSRTTERVLAIQTQAPDTSPMSSPEAYVTQESQPVTIMELYYGDDLSNLPAAEIPDDEVAAAHNDNASHHRTTSFEPRRGTSDVRMTVESRKVSTKQIEDASEEEDLDLVEADAGAQRFQRPVLRTTPAASPDGSRRAIWQAAGIILCLLVLFVLIGIIAWQEIAKRSRRVATAPTPAPPAVTQPVAPEGMVRIPEGTFRMGRDGGDRFERPAHSVKVESFFLDRTEVTNEQYHKFITDTRRAAPAHWQDGKFPAGEARFPVVNVAWQDASEYARWAGKRLPTESEWEFAARGSEGRLYPWGSKWEAGKSNARDGGAGRIAAVGSFPQGASPFGILDLSGNVWEWTANELTSYADGNRVLAPGRVIRGGAYDVPRDRATATYRGVVQPERSYDKTGFRCAK